ncbi:MAG: hypothetical protein AAFV95_26880 [Bacteroidota bacterium]
MIQSSILSLICFIGLIFPPLSHSLACSMCKITIDGKTTVGNNEDMWSNEAKIWFEAGNGTSQGAVYVGHRNDFPQGGMNESGLVYDGFTLHPKAMSSTRGKKAVDHPALLLKKVMQSCRNVAEVHAFLQAYNLSCFNSGMFWFIDKNGDHLIVESDTLIFRNEPHCALVNVRPSETEDWSKVTTPRYRKAMALLNSRQDSSMAFCASVMDAMKASRGELGDGTLYTSIYDTQEGIIDLYFYQDFEQSVRFHLQEELAKGDHFYDIASLFPPNAGYEKFLAYKTPFTSKALFWLLAGSAIVVLLISGYYFVFLIRKLLKERMAFFASWQVYLLSFLLVTNFLLLVLIPLLLLMEPIYYFGMEGSIGNFPFKQVQYFPLLIGICSLAALAFTIQVIKQRSGSVLHTSMLSINSVILIINLGLCAYWNILL